VVLTLLREENKLKVCENKVLRKIFGLEEDEVSEHFGTLYDEELGGLYRSHIINESETEAVIG
jgi:hypothetical protein